MTHSFLQAVISCTEGNYYQASGIIEELSVQYPQLKESTDVVALVNSMFALISYASIDAFEAPVLDAHTTNVQNIAGEI